MVIKNFQQLATSFLRRQALLIAEEAYRSIDTAGAVKSNVRLDGRSQTLEAFGLKYSLSSYRRIVCAGFGKAAFEAAEALEEILGEKISEGLVIGPEPGPGGAAAFKAERPAGRIRRRFGSHPYPSQANLLATREMAAMLEKCGEDDLVICIASGGGSSMLFLPYELSAREQGNVFEALTHKGADILELNTVRKHLSRVKGGNLAKIIYPATCLCLVFSDVPGDDMAMVASGPTVKDATTAADAAEILKKYDVMEAAGLAKCRLFETPKDDKYFRNVSNVLAVSAGRALEAMVKYADDLGFKARPVSNFSGQAKDLGPWAALETKKGECLVGAGESVVHIRGLGKGGRNQEMALAALDALKDGQVILCLASDGCDNTEAAGAIADSTTRKKARQLSLTPSFYLENNDSFNFFEQTGDLVYTGLTGSNVADFFVCLRS